MTRYDVTITDGHQAERHLDVGPIEKNRLADFAWRHELRAVVTIHEPADAGRGDVPMRTENLQGLYDRARLAVDDLERHGKDGVQVLGMEFGEMADGSGRTFASVDFTDENGNEEWVRFIAPASDDAPKWAPRDWETSGSLDDAVGRFEAVR